VEIWIGPLCCYGPGQNGVWWWVTKGGCVFDGVGRRPGYARGLQLTCLMHLAQLWNLPHTGFKASCARPRETKGTLFFFRGRLVQALRVRFRTMAVTSVSHSLAFRYTAACCFPPLSPPPHAFKAKTFHRSLIVVRSCLLQPKNLKFLKISCQIESLNIPLSPPPHAFIVKTFHRSRWRLL